MPNHGWGKHGRSTKRHYFRIDGWSICAQFKRSQFTVLNEYDSSPNVCSFCKTKLPGYLNKLRKKDEDARVIQEINVENTAG